MTAPKSMPDGSKPPRGFAAMDPKLVAEISRRGGKAAHAAGKAHEFTSAEAREAGRKGGLATRKRREPKTSGASATASAPTAGDGTAE